MREQSTAGQLDVPAQWTAVTRLASVVIPAHDEAAVIERCLTALLEDAVPGEFEVVVAANGCSDDTVARARAAAERLGQQVEVLDLSAASKAGALRAADAVADTYPRVYLDADVVCPTSTLRQLAAALHEPGVELAVPGRRLDLTGARRGARMYYRAWERAPRVRRMLAGRGCYALSWAGRARVGEFPYQVADDRFVTTSVPRHRVRVVTGEVCIFPPGDLRAVLRVRARIYAGNAELGRPSNAEQPSGAWARARAVGPLREWPSAFVYAAVTVVAKGRARRLRASGGPVEWGRDGARGMASKN